jgi:uncharacterized protein with GYD domain
MPKYHFQASYTEKGLSGLLKEGGSKHRMAVAQAISSLGGSMEAFYYAFGDNDAIFIADLPDRVSSTALSLIMNATGVSKVKTMVLITSEEIDQAMKKNVSYCPPGA